METDLAALFERAGCAGQLCVQSLDGTREISLNADEPVVSASVFKVSVALEVETQFVDGRLDPRERVVLPAAGRTIGPTGFSLFEDDVEVSLRDLVVTMLTISDNDATDALLRRVGIGAVNETSARLGLGNTVVTADLRTLLDSIFQEAGFESWKAAMDWHARTHNADQLAEFERQWRSSAALTGSRSTRTTAREMATLMRLIWTDQAGPAKACTRLRRIMSQQLTKNRLASGFQPPAKVSAKSGGLAGVIRNEVGVVDYPDGRSYAMAVFTQTQSSGSDTAINAAIGAAAASAVQALIGQEQDEIASP
jgi:beta-lactamase class A